MITKPTVLVLGAGASQAYGFPLGATLLRLIADGLKGVTNGPAQIVAQASGRSMADVHQFRRELLQARRLSIDAFIESRSDDYDRIGRCAIAQHLLRLESDDGLFPPLESDWYTILFDAILGKSPNAFHRNELRIITFNFDRSFERALYLALSANFAGHDIDELARLIPVLHVHGDLGLPEWAGPGRTSPERRAYVPATDIPSVSRFSERLKIVHHGIDDGKSQDIRDWLGWSRRVYFIGFSYHELNLKKLGVPASLEGKEVFGTRYGMGDGQVSRMLRLTERKITPVVWSAVDVLNTTPWFYED